MNILIVASGSSAKGFVPPDDITVIAVNGVIDWISRCDYWFTLDHSPVNMERMHNPRPGVKYFCACPDRIVLPDHVTRLKRVSGTGHLSAHLYLNTEGHINTGNSSWGALGLAFNMGAKKVLLLGVDADREMRCEGGFSNDLDHLPELFASALGQIDVRSAGKLSSVPQMSLQDGLEWLRHD